MYQELDSVVENAMNRIVDDVANNFQVDDLTHNMQSLTLYKDTVVDDLRIDIQNLTLGIKQKLFNKLCINIDNIDDYIFEFSDSLSNKLWNDWSYKSKDISFISKTRCVGNGEEKLQKELDITKPLGKQNNTFDLHDPLIGYISVKDMTSDDCRLGKNAKCKMRKLFRNTVDPFLTWIEQDHQKCSLAKQFFDDIHKSHGHGKKILRDCIDEFEISKSNLDKLNKMMNDLKNISKTKRNISKSKVVIDRITNYLGDKSLQDLLNECVRSEATTHKLIICHKEYGWFFVNNINKLTCPRITQGSPRIHYDF